MNRRRILFQGSHSIRARVDSVGRRDRHEDLAIAEPIAKALGKELIDAGFDLIFTGSRSLDAVVGASAVQACTQMGVDPRERIRTYLHGQPIVAAEAFGMVLESMDRRWQEARTFVVREADAVVALVGGKGTSDSLQKAVPAGKPVFPIAVAGGAARAEWERLKRVDHYNREPGDLDLLADKTADPATIARFVVRQCNSFFAPESKSFSRRIFIVHGHDVGLKNELARFLDRLQFKPVILHELADKGRAILSKLQTELADIGYVFVLLTPDDVGAVVSKVKSQKKRARQNVLFEYGLLIGLLGADRVCAILKGDIEVPSDLSGILFKRLDETGTLDSIAVGLVKELKEAGYEVDANKLWKDDAQATAAGYVL